ncbi:ribosome small subunit-dependent GTPase A [Tropicibacter naphthalenivorans]|uniref:Small ribosomal subunit biogenesis GTPase RsgA n=1 Tax=Tropicibacter naphthalenivorans TaxID=441103 RepID=A0A0P1GN27_9RHOB|nr:ribosome small subunit-dependent GTPase A [Tropicibacter naphthalenivorans]CUH76730.1 Putative ribosome biogenesis GTPase RsgA [Tropicibacter naphthalenivorans]SMC63404.1 ribosome biogenesis GTPase [Tropicibacter naphthalenivorans]
MTEQTLADLGWGAFFAQQLTDEDANLRPARVTEVQRDRIRAMDTGGTHTLIPAQHAGTYAVGDWVLTDGTHAQRRLDARSALTRKAAGHVAYTQRIAANVDTLGIVTSCNHDFSVARVERYLTLAAQAGCRPLLILTKPDKVEDHETAEDYLTQAHAIDPDLTAIMINAKDAEQVARLHPWCGNGQTLALLGSSGVGKTTLRNALTGENAPTQKIRQDDSKGRHTTTYRSLVQTNLGGWLIDTPGMRELQLADAQEGIEEVFDDLVELETQCKFRNCGHGAEPGCAIQAAIASGDLDAARLERWRKLIEEDARNSESVARQRERQKAFGKMVKGAKKAKKQAKKQARRPIQHGPED